MQLRDIHTNFNHLAGKAVMASALLAATAGVAPIDVQAQWASSASSSVYATGMQTLRVNEFKDKVLNAENPVLLMFTHPSCGPCKVLEPRLHSYARASGGEVDVYQINIATIPNDGSILSDYKNRFDIFATPTLVLFEDGVAHLPSHNAGVNYDDPAAWVNFQQTKKHQLILNGAGYTELVEKSDKPVLIQVTDTRVSRRETQLNNIALAADGRLNVVQFAVDSSDVETPEQRQQAMSAFLQYGVLKAIRSANPDQNPSYQWDFKTGSVMNRAPSYLVYQNGEFIGGQAGVKQEADIRNLVKQAVGYDIFAAPKPATQKPFGL